MVRWEKLDSWSSGVVFINPTPSFLRGNEVMLLHDFKLSICNVETEEQIEWILLQFTYTDHLLSNAIKRRPHNAVTISKQLGDIAYLLIPNEYPKQLCSLQRIMLNQKANDVLLESTSSHCVLLAEDELHILQISTESDTYRDQNHHVYSVKNGSFTLKEVHSVDINVNDCEMLYISSMRSILVIDGVYGLSLNEEQQRDPLSMNLFSLQTRHWKQQRLPIPNYIYWYDDRFGPTFRCVLAGNEEYMIMLNRGDLRIYILELSTMSLYLSAVPMKRIELPLSAVVSGICERNTTEQREIKWILSYWTRQIGMNPLPRDIDSLIAVMSSKEYIHVWRNSYWGYSSYFMHLRISVDLILKHKRTAVFVGKEYRLKRSGHLVRVKDFDTDVWKWTVSLKSDPN